MKKFFKFVSKLILSLILIISALYGGFHLWEYSTGGKYVKYLQENSETKSIADSFTFSNMKNDLEKSKIILVGEIHGMKEPGKFDVDFFKHINQRFGVKHYFAELDFVQAEYLNQFLKSNNQELLKKVLKNWVVIQARNNQDYFDKYLQFQEYYTQVSAEKKFSFVGIDKIQDWELTTSYLNEFIPTDSSLQAISFKKEGIADVLLNQIKRLGNIYSRSKDTTIILNHLKLNIEYSINKTNREAVLFNNFKSLYEMKSLNQERVYGFFGLYHIFKYRVNGKHPLASQIREAALAEESEILSINFMMNDSYMVMPSSQLPDFMRDQGAYTRMPVSADNMLIMYIYGIKDFKRMTDNNQKSIVKMNGERNPYVNTNRLNKTIQLLPVTDLFELTDKGKPYVQYTVFVRNSDWAEPMQAH